MFRNCPEATPQDLNMSVRRAGRRGSLQEPRALWDEFATVRLQKLEQQQRLLEKKQRRKRLEPLMVQANPVFLLPQRHGCQKERLVGDNGLVNPFFQKNMPQANVHSRTLSNLTTVSCSGDGSSKLTTLLSSTEDCSDLELEEVFVENIPASPRPYKELQGTPRWGWTTGQRPGPSGQDESKPQYIRDEYQQFNPELNPNVADQGQGDEVSKSENLEEQNQEESKFTASDALEASDSSGVSDSSGAPEKESSQTPEEEGDLGCNVVVSAQMLPSTPHLQLNQDIEAYVLRPAMKEQIVQCRIFRDKKGLDKSMFPLYYLYLEAAYGKQQFLLSGRKRKRSKTSNYLITMDSIDLSRNGSKVVGKVRSNVLGTKFTIFDNGVNPERNFHSESARIRKELGAVCYETNVLGSRGPRKMTVTIPAIDGQNERVSIEPQNGSLLDQIQMGVGQQLVRMHNKTPYWSNESGAYKLNFHGRVTRASVKNFQIVYPDNSGYVVLQFGRVASDMFTMDFTFPFCPLQAFAICLSSFDRKLVCE